MLWLELSAMAQSGTESMADIINLRLARKARARTAAEAQLPPIVRALEGPGLKG
jgi:hypothetical protein